MRAIFKTISVLLSISANTFRYDLVIVFRAAVVILFLLHFSFHVSAQRSDTPGNHKFTWEIEGRHDQSAFILIARGHDAQYLDSYSVKKKDQEEID